MDAPGTLIGPPQTPTSLRTRRVRTVAGGLLLFVLLAGCGSSATPVEDESLAVDAEEADELRGLSGSPPESRSGLPSDVFDGTQPVGVADTSAPDSSPVRDRGTAGAEARGVPGDTSEPAVATSGRGFTADTLRVGYTYSSDEAEVLNALGVTDVSAGDTRTQMDALAEYVNERGGILGRQLEFSPADMSTAREARGEHAQMTEEACIQWTMDDRVFVVVRPGLETPQLRECLAKRDTPLIGQGGTELDEAEYRKHASYLYHPARMSLQTLWPVWVRTLLEGGYFSGWDTRLGEPGLEPAKVGLVYPDTPDARRSVEILKLALAHAGHPVEEEASFEQSLDGSAAGNQSAILRFRSQGITHVIGANLFFVQAAHGQQYYPRYGFTLSTRQLAANSPPRTMAGSMAAGSAPAYDVAAPEDPGPPSSATVLCEEIMERAAQDVHSDRTTLHNVRIQCDAIFLVQAALERSQTLSTAGLRAGIEALGDTLPSTQTWSSVWGPDQHASGRSLRLLAYDEDCACFTYRGPVVLVD